MFRHDNSGWHSVTKLSISSSLVPGHHYCIDNMDTKINDGQFDLIDRSDETRVIAAQSPLDLNISSLTPCNTTDGRNNPGVWCWAVGYGVGNVRHSNCKMSGLWCFDNQADTCRIGSRDIKVNNPALCRDPRVWANVSCSYNWDDKDGIRRYHGLRCTGQNMRCVVPWYTVDNGEPYSSYVTQCPDKSDQVFNSSHTCSQHLQQHIDFHTQSFCNDTRFRSELVCTNKSEWLVGKDKSYTDPHSCQSSCLVPGPECKACTNSSYFLCPKSGQCVHPDLECDGVPNCKEGEDENVSKCREKYLKMRIIQPFAQFRCRSKFYKNMEILATARNNITECYDGSDEPQLIDPSRGDNSIAVLVISAIFIMLVYIGLKYSGLAKKMLSTDSTDNQNLPSIVESDQNLYQEFLDFKTLKCYGENHDQIDTIENTNIHILNSINTQNVDNNMGTCELFYELEQEIHEGNESEMHICLHKKMDPKVVENILDSGEPGCTAGCIEGFENCIRRRLITEIQDKITKSPITKEILGTTFGVIKTVTKYVDLYKDTALSLIMFQDVGSFESVWEFKTNFSSVILITMFSSILIPLLLSTFHLIVNRKKVINEDNFSKLGKCLTIALCWIASFLNPIILDVYYQELKEDVRRLTQNHDIRAIPMIRKCRNIKYQMVTFHKIELGKIRLLVFHHFHITYRVSQNKTKYFKFRRYDTV